MTHGNHKLWAVYEPRLSSSIAIWWKNGGSSSKKNICWGTDRYYRCDLELLPCSVFPPDSCSDSCPLPSLTHTKVCSLRKIELAVPYPSVVKTFYQLLWLLSTGYCQLNNYTNLKLNKPLLSSLKKLLMKEINEHCNLQMIVLWSKQRFYVKLYYWCNKLGKTCPVESSETNYKTYHLKIQSMFQSHIITADKSCVIHLYVLQLCMR